MRALVVVLALVLAGLAGILAGCGSGDDERPVTVLAAASLTDAFEDLGADARYSFAGSDTLAAQIREGAPADVFAAANTRLPTELAAEGLVEEPRVFARNRLVLLVPAGNPAGIRSLDDLGRSGVSFLMADEGVPAGDYTRDLLTAAERPDLVDRAASQENDVRAVAQKVALGEADAGFTYSSDIAASPDDLEVVSLPPAAAPAIEYGVAVVSESDQPAAARAFVDELLSEQGQEVLASAGLEPA